MHFNESGASRVEIGDAARHHDRPALERISVIGLGRLGLPLAACFAWRGFPTVAVDIDPSKVQAIRDGKALGYEPDLQAILAAHQGRLTTTGECEEAVADSDVTFVVVPTPSDERGTFSLKHVMAALENVGAALRRKTAFHIVVVVSTIMPGTMAREIVPLLERQSGKRCGRDFGLCYSPEFIALGSVIRDLLHPDFVLIGESDPESGEKLAGLYARFCELPPRVARMNFVNAEVTKLAINSYLTTRISFANMLARLCERLPNSNVDVVTAAVGLDSRIGEKYFKGAVAFGGPCFPRDNAAFAALARSVDAPADLAQATDMFNRDQGRWLAGLVCRRLPRNGQVGILGLAYKPDSDVVEEAPGLRLAQELLAGGIGVVAYDPAAIPQAREALRNRGRAEVRFASSARACIRHADVVVVATPWDEFKQITLDDCTGDGRRRVLIDCWRIVGHLRSTDRFVYVPLGIGDKQ